jgi:hypothetical protein
LATYLYGLVLERNARRVPATAGIGGAPARVIDCGSLAAIVSTVETMPARASLDDVRAHDAVLQAVVENGSTVAAVRFKQSFANDGDVCRHVAERAERVARLLEDDDGCVEMRLLIPAADEAMDFGKVAEARDPSTDSETSAHAVGPGRAYLETLRAGFRGGGRKVNLSLAAALGPTIHAERVEELPKSQGVVFAHLVKREEVQAYRDAVATLPSLADATVVGPLALYSFAEPTS